MLAPPFAAADGHAAGGGGAAAAGVADFTSKKKRQQNKRASSPHTPTAKRVLAPPTAGRVHSVPAAAVAGARHISMQEHMALLHAQQIAGGAAASNVLRN